MLSRRHTFPNISLGYITSPAKTVVKGLFQAMNSYNKSMNGKHQLPNIASGFYTTSV